MQNVKNDSDIAAGYNSIMFAHARKLHEQKFPTSTIKDIVYMTFSLFRLYIAEHEDAEKFHRYMSSLNTLSLNELKSEAQALEKKLHLYSNMQHKILKYLTTLVTLHECTDLMYAQLIRYDCFSLKYIISKLRGIKQEVFNLRKDPILHSECTYVSKLLHAYNYVSEHYLIAACTTLTNQCGYDEPALLEYINICQVECENLTPKPCTSFIALYKQQSDAQTQTMLQILLKYAKLCLIRGQAYTDIETHIFSLYDAMQGLEKVADKKISDMLNLSGTWKAIAEKYMPQWRNSGKINSIEHLVKVIDCLAKWRYYLSGKQLQRALRMKLEAEIEYIEYLKTDELLKYYDHILFETIGVKIKVHEENADPIRCCALISTQLFKLYEAIGKRLDVIAPGWGLPKIKEKSEISLRPATHRQLVL